MAESQIKRLGFVSSEAGSIGRSHRNGMVWLLHVKGSAEHGGLDPLQRSSPGQFYVRVYHPGWIRSYMRGVKSTIGDLEPEEAAGPALAFFLSGLEGEPPAEPPYDEDRLVMRDLQGQDWPW